MKRLFCVALLPALLAGGCGKKVDAAAPAAAISSPAGAASASPPVAVPNALAGAPTSTVADDPSRDGWDTEAANELIGQRLSVLKAWLTAEMRSAEEGAKIIAKDCRGLAVPEGDAAGYQYGGVSVRRSRAGARGEAVEGLAAVMAALDKLRQGRDAHAAMKVTSIRQVDEGWETGLKVELSESIAKGHRQWNTEWKARWSRAHPPLLTHLAMGAWEEVTAAGGFADCTEALFGANDSWRQQLAYGTDHWTARIESILGMDVNGQNSVTLGDINGDGLDDVYLTQQGGLPNRMFVRQAGGGLQDVTAASGTGWLDDCHAALLLDFDNDGDQDLACGVRDGVLFMANDGTGKFTVKTAKLAPTGVPYGLSAADYDQDGDLDVYVACYYQRTTAARNETFARPIPYYDAENGAQDMLLRNDGNWRFTDAAKVSGIVENKFSYAPSWEDYDNDGDPDLYVANDFGANRLWRNERTPEGVVVFKEVARAAGVQDIAAGMSSAWGDPDNDGRMDLYVGNMFSSAGNRIAFQDKFQSAASDAERGLFRRHARGNSLFHNTGSGFDDISEAAGVTLGRWAWCSRFGDVNNDGREDLYVANGYITQEDPHDL